MSHLFSLPCFPSTATNHIVWPTASADWSRQKTVLQKAQQFSEGCVPWLIQLQVQSHEMEGLEDRVNPLFWWLQSHWLVKLVRKLGVLWEPVTKFLSFGKYRQSFLTCLIVHEIMAWFELEPFLQVQELFGSYPRRCCSLTFVEVQCQCLLRIFRLMLVYRKGVNHPMIEICFFL